MKVLVLTHRLPFAPNRGDRIRAFHIVKQLAARADVHVVSLVHDREEEAQADTLRQLGVAVSTALVPRTRNLALARAQAADVDAADPPAARLAGDAAGARAGARRAGGRTSCSPTAPAWRRSASVPPLAGIPFVLDMVDVDSAKWAAFAGDARLSEVVGLSARSAVPVGVRGARRPGGVRRDGRERARARHAAAGVPGAAVHVAPNGVDVDALAPPQPPAADDRVIFSAVFDYAPNADGAVWFARERLAARARGAAVGAADAGRFVADRRGPPAGRGSLD